MTNAPLVRSDMPRQHIFVERQVKPALGQHEHTARSSELVLAGIALQATDLRALQGVMS